MSGRDVSRLPDSGRDAAADAARDTGVDAPDDSGADTADSFDADNGSLATPLTVADRRIGGVKNVAALDLADIDGDRLPDVSIFSDTHFGWLESPDDPVAGDWVKHEFTKPAELRNFLGATSFGDIDGDGDPDVVVSTDRHHGDLKEFYLYWLENPRPNDAATDAWAVHTIRADAPYHHINDMAVEDLDSDGRLDVIVRALEPNRLLLYFQNGDGSFAEKSIDSTPFGAQGEGFAVGDIDRAGHPDITICGHWLQAPSAPRTDDYAVHDIDASYKENNHNCKEAVGDIDGDGRNDVVISPAEGYRNGGNHILAWYAGPDDPSAVSEWERHELAGDLNGGHTVRLADMNRDGTLDIVHGIAWDKWGQSKSIKIYFNAGAGVFDFVQTISDGRGLYTGRIADIGDDGDLDIVGQHTYGNDSKVFLYATER